MFISSSKTREAKQRLESIRTEEFNGKDLLKRFLDYELKSELLTKISAQDVIKAAEKPNSNIYKFATLLKTDNNMDLFKKAIELQSKSLGTTAKSLFHPLVFSNSNWNKSKIKAFLLAKKGSDITNGEDPEGVITSAGLQQTKRKKNYDIIEKLGSNRLSNVLKVFIALVIWDYIILEEAEQERKRKEAAKKAAEEERARKKENTKKETSWETGEEDIASHMEEKPKEKESPEEQRKRIEQELQEKIKRSIPSGERYKTGENFLDKDIDIYSLRDKFYAFTCTGMYLAKTAILSPYSDATNGLVITSVMERRYAHLYQFYDVIKRVVDEAKKLEKKNSGRLAYNHQIAEELINRLNDALGAMRSAPGKIANIKFSDSFLSKCKSVAPSCRDTVIFLKNDRACAKSLMITSHEVTDRAFGMFEYYMLDGGGFFAKKIIFPLLDIADLLDTAEDDWDNFKFKPVPSSTFSSSNPYEKWDPIKWKDIKDYYERYGVSLGVQLGI